MKRILLITALAIISVLASAAGKRTANMTVVYQTSMECRNCERKIIENISFEKGVKDLSTNLDKAQVTIVFAPDKTDTLKLANAIRKLGYTAKVISLK